jgi:hypothetical protein
MKRRAAFLILLAATIVLLLAFPSSSFAATWKSSNSVTIPSGTTIHDDFYAGGGNVTIDGDIDGNLFIGGGNIIVNGKVSKSLFVGGGTVTVNGDAGEDIMIGGGTVTVNGDAGGNIMIGGGQISISSLVKNDVLIGGGTVDIAKKTTIGRDLLLGGGTVTMGGSVARNLRAGATDLTLTGSVTGDTNFEGDNLLLDKGATIGGNLTYYSANKAKISTGAAVEGETKYHHVTKQQKQEDGGGIPVVGAVLLVMFWFCIFFLSRLVVGLVLVGLAPRPAASLVETLRSKPWQCLGIGLVVLMFTPIVCVFLAVTLIGLPLALILLHLYIFAIYASMFVTGLFLGRWLLSLIMKREPGHMGSMLLGIFILALVTAIPFVGWLISLISIVFGTGTLSLGMASLVRLARAKPIEAKAKTAAVPPTKEKPKKK